MYGSVIRYTPKSEMDAFHTAKRSAISAIKRTLEEIDRCIMVHEAPRYHRLCQEMQHGPVPLPREVRDVVYGYILRDSTVRLREEEREEELEEDEAVDRPLDWLTERSIPYSYLLQPTGYFEDYPVIRQELIEAWYEKSTFYIAGANNINTFHSRSQWSAGLEPLKHVRKVEIAMPEHDLTVNQARYRQQLESLFVLKKSATITIGLWDLIPEGADMMGSLFSPTMDQYAGFVGWLFPVLRRLRVAGYKVIVRLERDLKFLVEPEETTVEGWAKNIHAAIEKRETLMSREYFIDEDESDSNRMWDTDGGYDSDYLDQYADPYVD